VNLRALLILLAALSASSASAQIARACEQYQTLITRSALQTFGPDAPVATLAAQLHLESACREAVSSHVGAQGMAQFMPATAADMARLHPQDCAPAAPFSARWAVACRDRYMRGLLEQYSDAATESDQWAFALSAYNGGAGWVRRDRLACDVAPFPAFVDRHLSSEIISRRMSYVRCLFWIPS